MLAGYGRSGVLAAMALALAYWLSAVVGLQWALVGGAGSPVWPAAGVALAGLLLGGARLWPAIVIGRLAASLTVGSDHTLGIELIIAGGNALAAVLPVLLLQHWARLDLRLTTMRDVLWLALAAGLSATIAGALGTATLWLATGLDAPQAFSVGLSWWFGNVVGMLTVAPLILAWSDREVRAMPLAEWAHLGVVLVVVGTLSYFVFAYTEDPELRTWYVFPGLIWAALALRVRGAAAALVLATGVSVWGASVGLGPFVDLAAEPAQRVFLLQQFAAITSLTVLILAAVADERRGKQALRDSEERFRLLVDGVRDHALFMLDPQGGVSMWNAGAERLTGWPAKDILRRHFSVFFAPGEIQAGTPAALLDIAAERGVHGEEGSQLRHDGSKFVAQVTVTALNSEAGELRGFAVLTRDVTDRKQVEAALRESERRLQTLVGNLPGMAYRCPVSQAWSLSYASEGVLQLTGYSPADVMGKEDIWLEIMHPDDRHRVRIETEVALAERRAFDLVYRIRHADGSTRWVLDRGSGIYEDSTGMALAVEGFVGDVTRQRQAEDRLRRRSKQLQKLAEAALVVARAPSLEAMIEEATQAARRIIGTHQALASHTRGADWSQSISSIVLSDKYAQWRDFDVVPDGTGVYCLVCEHNRPMRLTQAELEAHPGWRGFGQSAGSHPPMRGWLAVPLVGRDGRNLGLFQLSDKEDGSDFDEADEAMLVQLAQLVSAAVEQFQAETAQRELTAELERKVEERTAELVQLQKIENIGRLTGGIAHDFNNLLMAVLASLELLHKRLPADDSRSARLIDNAMQGAKRGVGLTQRMLAFARKQDLSPKPVSIPDLVVGMTELLQRSLGPRIRIETRFADAVPKALIDPNQLELAILNLAVNASDAMPEGGTLTLQVDVLTIGDGDALAPGRYVRLVLSDTGAGMDVDTLRHAMEPFFTTKGPGKGTGLGLPMVLGLAEQSGGRFRLDSAPGRGTTAEIVLPAAAPVAPGETQAALLDPVAEESQWNQLSVLVVDDDVLVLMGTAGMVEDLGHVAIEAASGRQALDILNSGRSVDVVVTDQAMPGMTGVQLAMAMRAVWPHIPVILATGYADLPAGSDQLAIGRLNKPFRQEDLAAALDRAVRHGPAEVGAAGRRNRDPDRD